MAWQTNGQNLWCRNVAHHFLFPPEVKTDMYMYMLKGIPTHHISISDLKPAKNAGKLVFSGVDSALNVKCLLKRGKKDITHKIKSTY